MAITKRSPNTIYLGGGHGPGGEGGYTLVNDLVAIETITPGMLLEPHDDSGTSKWGVHDSVDDATVQPIIAMEQSEMNLTVDDNYAAGDLVKAAYGMPGSLWWMIVASGVTVANEGLLQSNGAGKLKALATGVARFRAKESSGGALAADTRMRVEVI